MTRVVVVDDQQMFRMGLRAILQAQDDLEVVGEAADGAEAVALVLREQPDVVLMDVRMPHLDGIEATRRITAAPADRPVRIVMLTTFDVDDYVFDALRAGRAGSCSRTPRPRNSSRRCGPSRAARPCSHRG